MITVKEFLDIGTVERIRFDVLGKPLDDTDNFSLHIAETDDNGKVLGVARLYRTDEGITIDNVAVLETEDFYTRDLLQRTMILRAASLTKDKIRIFDNSKNLYTAFGFEKISEGEFLADAEKIRFTHDCCVDGKRS